MRASWARSAAIAFVCALFVAPLAFMVLGSLRPPNLPPPDGFELLPPAVRWANYESVFDLVPLARQLRNSLIVAALAVPVTVLVASLAGFALASSTARARRILIGLSIAAMLVPVIALWVPRFLVYRSLGVLDTLVPLIAPSLMATTPFYVLLFGLTYSRIPRSLFEAAQVEGLSPLATWRRVAWPLGRATTFAVAVLAFVWHWSNFIDPLLYTSSGALHTVPLGLRALHELEPTLHPILLAASVMATLPPVLAFLLGQRAFFDRALEVR